MKNIQKSVCAVAILAVSSFAVANTAVNQHATTGGHVNHHAVAPTVVTVKQALTQKDETKVQLRGQVIKSIGDEKYEFRDSTGTIPVNIDHKLWQGKPVSDKTTVTLLGEIDVDYKPTKHVEVDVDSIQF